MRKSLLRRPSPALVVAFVALVVALGGTSYAAFSLPKNSVGSKQIKNGAVTNSKLKKGAVTTGKIKNGTVTKSKINTSGLTVPNALHANSADIATSAVTAANAASLTGVSRFRTTIASSGSDPSTGARITLGTSGPLAIQGVCYTTGGETTSEVDAVTTAPAHVTSYSSLTNTPLTPGTPQRVSEEDVAAAPGTIDQDNPYDGTFSAITDDAGAAITGLISNAVNENGGTGCTFAGFTVGS